MKKIEILITKELLSCDLRREEDDPCEIQRYDDPQKNRRGKPQGTEAHEPYEHGDSPCCLGLLKGKWSESPDLKIQAQDPGDR